MRGGSNRLLTPSQTAEFLAVSLNTLYSNWRVWGLTAYRVGRHLRFRERDLETWLRGHIENTGV
ncbi:helix-turn-helix domain-containing protein [Streptomyces prunicolor]|uniref:helix-turn-helix domain-containing protein n=1 Tax=Streptomyces prunicolor TaxID=67348 RepID=UPI00344A1D4C